MLDIVTATSARVHALTGSSRPGAVPPLVPLVTTPDGSATAPYASKQVDAEVIDLAARVIELLARENALWDRRSAVEGAVDDATPPHPASVMDTASAAFAAAVTEHDRHVAEVSARLGLPRWEKLSGRASCRLARWGARLARMAPRTQAGLRAKAEASTACIKDEIYSLDDWRKDLATSVSADALRIIGAEADARASECSDPFTGYHAEILGLQTVIATTDERSPEQAAAWERWKELDTILLRSRPTTLAGAVGALEVAQREHHQFSIQDHQNDEVGTDDRLIHHLLTTALDVLRPLVQPITPTMANLRPAPLPSGIVAGRYPDNTSREDVETYRTFLEMELRYLNHEIYGQTEGRLHFWLNNPAGRMHGPSQPAASTRAVAVLTLLGLVPLSGVHGQVQADGLARVDASAA